MCALCHLNSYWEYLDISSQRSRCRRRHRRVEDSRFETGCHPPGAGEEGQQAWNMPSSPRGRHEALIILSHPMERPKLLSILLSTNYF